MEKRSYSVTEVTLTLEAKRVDPRFATAADLVLELKAGDALCLWREGAFGTSIILGFTSPDEHGDVWIKLARPYAYASGVGTLCPGVLLAAEVIEITTTKLLTMWTIHTRTGTNFVK